MITIETQTEKTPEKCQSKMRSIRDALEVLHGRWKLPILHSLAFGSKRFRQISKDINGITDKVLSNELKALETNQLIVRVVHDTFPPTVEYFMTAHGKSLENVLEELEKWGETHRKLIIGK